MAFLKIYRHARQHGLLASVRKMLKVVPGYIVRIYLWRVRRCQCCDRLTLFLTSSVKAEFRTCLFCSANERYELLATEIKTRFGSKLHELSILELDPHSPLRDILACARSYKPSFYEPGVSRGSARPDGTVCEDITALTFDNESLDLIISSDVLEHVPSLERAFKETARVLRPGGVHLFTVPPRSETKPRAEIRGGHIRHIETPEYHGDPLSPKGILAFWDVGPDLPEIFLIDKLDIKVARGPSGDEGRIVWIAERRISL